MKKIFILLLSVLFVSGMILLFPDISQAQPPPPPVKPAQNPIDGGLGLLAAAGGAYAIKKLRDKKSKLLTRSF